MTEQELIDYADGILTAINQSTLTGTEQRLLWLKPHANEQEIYDSLAWLLNKRGGQGDAVARLKAYGTLSGVYVNVNKSVENNVFLGSVL